MFLLYNMILCSYTFQTDNHNSVVIVCHCTKILHSCRLYSHTYVSYLWLIYFTAGNLYLLISLTYYFAPLTPPANTCLSSVSITLFLFNYICSFFFGSTGLDWFMNISQRYLSLYYWSLLRVRRVWGFLFYHLGTKFDIYALIWYHH